MKLDLILENVKNRYTLGLLEESTSEVDMLKGKIILHEATMSIRNMLIEEGAMQNVRNVLEEAWTSAIIEEALTAQQADAYNNTSNTVERVGAALGGVPLVGGLAYMGGQMKAGYDVGSKLGHNIAGTILGREGALGATSSDGKNNNITVGDAYQAPVMATRALGGATSGALTGGLIAGLPGAAAGAAIGGLTAPLLTPGLRYGMGKVFGSKKI